MNLVVQGQKVETRALKDLATLTASEGVGRLGNNAFRLLKAQPSDELATYCEARQLDYAFVPEERRLKDFRLFVTDMDSTLINIECIDEIADMQGLKAEVAAITEAAMRGELDFRESLTRRVALLEGLPEEALARVFNERLQLNPGAEALIAGLKQAGIVTVLVSGGFTYFTERLQKQLGFDYAVANQLDIRNGKLTGKVKGDVVDGEAKRHTLQLVRKLHSFAPATVIAAGDGANDLPMLTEAGVGIAYHAKPVVREKATYALNHSGLDGILNLFA
ncbi:MULTISPECIES: phosphoserine phosphatase SerB [Zoogloea]|uniref:Phosphoserine phosphatase n=1 Tax=Zoogloea oleivorans TaxID=1552750 RepID=A0A6C2CND7_9RHOO|nr:MULTISPECIES: phosphoserine phosphatase SerB [Zoogloea]MDD2668039.1 phosphoserine phosphatase SerB [Zoogloea sp.]TYC54882.1 phosphoserine phosphatase SerB [Zoogloea oleivorans]